MVVGVRSATVAGLDVRPIRVEVSITRGTPMIQIVGLAQSAVREGRERIRAAAAQLGLHVPGLRITVNLAPADLPKSGAALDLPILLGILCAAGHVRPEALERSLVVGELGLDGTLRSIRGALPIAMHAADATDVERLLLPHPNLREAGAAQGIDVRGASTLGVLLDALRGGAALPSPSTLGPVPTAASEEGVDFASVRGQVLAKRALEIAAAGAHNVLLNGSPGAGKTTLARCLPGLLPEPSTREAVEVTAVHSVAGLIGDGEGLRRSRPFRAPHHTISDAGLLGGGSTPRPGEASLAHRGVLFLDELPEFGRRALEGLRQPLEEGYVRIVRAGGAATFPTRFVLVAAMNPCACGFLGVEGRCRCSAESVRRYARRVSGPLLDRIDLRVDVPALNWEELQGDAPIEPSAAVRSRVDAARGRALARGGCVNAEVPAADLERVCRPESGAVALLRTAVTRLGLSARGYHRTLRLARTISDLSADDRVTEASVAEAIRYRGAS